MVSEGIPWRRILAPAPAAAYVWLVVVVLIYPTLQPGVAYWDTAEFQVLGPVMGTGHAPGYPAYAILGWLANLVLAY